MNYDDKMKTFLYSPKTICKWTSLYQTGGIDALMPREHSDKGATRALPDTAVEEIHRLKETFPRLNATQIHRQLVEDSFIPSTVSVCTVQRVYCIMVIDDHSCLLAGGGQFYNDNAYNFQKVLKQVVAAYGIPIKLYVDNGCCYSNEQFSLICGSIGTVLLHTKIRNGASKAKVGAV